jgi:hypothetical protein
LVVLAGFVVVSAAVSYWRARRHGTADPITRHGRALDTLRDIYQDHTAPPAGTVGRETAESPKPLRATTTTIAPPPVPPAPTLRVPGRPGVDRRLVVVAGSAVVVIVAAVVAFTVVGGDDGPTTASTAAPTAPPATTATTAAPTTTPPTTAPLAITDRNGTPTVVVAPPFTLVLTATATSWTQVHDDQAGTNLYVGTLSAGDSQSIDVPGPATLTLGNAHGVDLQVNGTALDTTALPATTDLAFVAS